MCAKCGKGVHGRYVKLMRVTSTLAKSFVCEQYVEPITGIVKQDKEISLLTTWSY